MELVFSVFRCWIILSFVFLHTRSSTYTAADLIAATLTSAKQIKKEADASSLNREINIDIPRDYSIHEAPPTPDGGPTHVEFHILVVDIRDIDEVQEELTLEFNLQMYWRDARLTHWGNGGRNKTKSSYGVLNPMLIKDIWHPDIFIDHVKKIEQPKVISTPASLRVYFKDGRFRYSGRFNMKMACQMVFQYYPADTQRCEIMIKSYSYSNKTLFIDWYEGKPAAIKRGVLLPNFAVALGNTENFYIKTSSSFYTGIRFAVILRRYLGFHLIQTYLPSCLFVIVSFLTFLVSHESVLECMTLCMTTLLTLTAMFASVKQNTPTVSYIKGLDIWMVTCIFCVFFTLLEHTVLLKLRARLSGYPAPSPTANKKKRKMKNRDREKIISRVSTPRFRRKKPSRPSQEPLTPHYHISKSKCKECSSASCSGEDEASPVLKIKRFHTTSNGHLSPESAAIIPGTAAMLNKAPSNGLMPNNGMIPNMHCPSPIIGMGHRARSPSMANINPTRPMTPTDALLLSGAFTPAFAMNPRDHRRFRFSRNMEVFCSKLIPISFLVFNCIYWPWLLRSADYYNMKDFQNTNYAA